MSEWEPSAGASNEWYTPKYIFDALGEVFDLDVAAPEGGPPHVPCETFLTEAADGMAATWNGFVWMNPPFGGRNALDPWLDKFFHHGNGIALTPDRTSAPWWHNAAAKADAILFTRGKVSFLRPDGSVGKSPGSGTTLWACGQRAVDALLRAQTAGLGAVWTRREEFTW